MTPGLSAACARAVHVVCDDGRVLKGGSACVFVLGILGWRRAAAVLAIPPLSWAVEGGYRLVARNRSLAAHLLSGKDG
jgi:predicted DCC family thiol-disulfide oxidoreductase YuxK